MRYAVCEDDDGHWYLVPADRLSEWSIWRDLSDHENVPDFAKRIDGPHRLTFADPVEE